ncbi:hypothetical protein [Salmonella phage Tennessee]|uniref:Uncharacterized protein n=1 Tax=Salmonella phage GEC_vB_N5 TaxID=2777378 RepID=A0A7S9SRR1_9CAUD|nr:hypothetical protein GECvBN5_gp134 [Salmonella phage GEC_vB_N5]UYL23082.1 hypothetical protein [Salmonella phage PS3-1]WNL62870.1 hypothetical protein [Escherichia phage Es2]
MFTIRDTEQLGCPIKGCFNCYVLVFKQIVNRILSDLHPVGTLVRPRSNLV